MTSSDLLKYLGFNSGDFEIIIIKSNAQQIQNKQIPHVEANVAETSGSFYIDKIPNNETYSHKELTAEQYIAIDKLVEPPSDPTAFQVTLKSEPYESHGSHEVKKRSRYFEEDFEESSNKRFKYDKYPIDHKFCTLCKIVGHTVSVCTCACKFEACKRRHDLHFGNNCPLLKPCIICGRGNHRGFDCYDLCIDKTCKQYKKYHDKRYCYRR